MASSVEERFWAKVQLPAEPDGCLVWVGARTSHGYGHMNVKGSFVKAHRLSLELLVGPIPTGLVVDHLCRNKACVNPNHLEPVTQKVNVHRGEGVAAIKARKTHCLNGHEFTVENTYVDRLGGRRCKTCIKRRGAERYAAKKKG